MPSVLQDKPDRLNYHNPSPMAKGIGDHFRNHIVGTIDIGVDLPPCRAHEQPAFDTLPDVLIMMANRLTIQETALGGMAFFR
ncbi:MAG TPA: hypothetical protein VKB76_04275, partial [Ktedonobacterales bacterium]|nr:hypothetical protein [Ktedonobacterales bacterium]